MFPTRKYKAHYDEYGEYINTYGENQHQALLRYKLQARQRAQHRRWLNKCEIRNGCMVMTFMAFNKLVFDTFHK